ncbi:hypothetical protein OM076_38900 [Solirubrobacter ginsenosidimutans]|uniref:Uncharacterized protein n=1 Tax=Solirubrobacter ginsenosidimutans TaxID=490573 RepID=A0A9X3N0R2_9ACTN|nr:hypothetical protein [Solirubrobacter ginsenosidimutans]MDA0166299.1 hypothetical protein [Solirubrobacter ginsenosidimutans]
MPFRNELIPIDGVDEPQAAGVNEVKWLGDHPVVVRVRTGDATAEIAVRSDDSELARGLRNTPEAVVAST